MLQPCFTYWIKKVDIGGAPARENIEDHLPASCQQREFYCREGKEPNEDFPV